MTLGEGRRKVLMLIDEYSSGGVRTEDKDIDVRMTDFFDLAQKDICGRKRLIRSFVPGPEEEIPSEGEGEAAREETAPTQLETLAESMGRVACPAPDNFGQVFRVWRDGKLTRGYPWSGKHILLPREEVGRVVVEYFAIPAAIPQDAGDDYEFEVEEDAAACMPYFVAAQQLLVDLVVDYTPLMEIYERMTAMLDTRLPQAGGNGVRQAFYS